MAATPTREKVVERLVAWIWEQQALRGPLPGDDGHQYEVVFRGRTWGERGPDFQGAVLARADGLLLRGDVEIHVRASDWRRHGHARDPAYNQAACQVVLWQDETGPARRQDGVPIPTLELVTRLVAPLAELERRAATAPSARADRPGRSGRMSRPERAHGEANGEPIGEPAGALPDPLPLADPATAASTAAPAAEGSTAVPRLLASSEANGFMVPLLSAATEAGACVGDDGDLAALLERAGVARFLEHASRFEGELACLPADEVLYRGALRAMGYTANTRGFERLGARLPLAALRALAGEARADPLPVVQAALLGAAGLLPGQRGIAVDDGWPDQLEAAWARHAATLATPLPPDAWTARRARPENAPVRRAAGFSLLVSRWQREDLVDAVLAELAAAQRAASPATLAARWQARAADGSFWAHHQDFGRLLAAPQPWLVGAGRAAEVVVNAVLPFAYAYGQAAGDPALSARALALYRAYPSGPPNRVVREMAVQVGGPSGARLARGACRQQGLIHLYRHWCDPHDCASCAAGRAASDASSGLALAEPLRPSAI